MSREIEIDSPSGGARLVGELAGFEPAIVDRRYLERLGVAVEPDQRTVDGLVRGSHNLARRLARGILVPRPRVILEDIDPGSDLEIHNYTGACPTMTYEINPMAGCHLGCLYCLVTDGSHEQELRLRPGCPEQVERVLEREYRERHFFYFSPRTEAFQEATLQTGVAHDVLRVFIAHYRRHPDSRARLFIASKAGSGQLSWRHQGRSVLDLFEQLAGRMQFNTSLSIMPEGLRRLLEPFAPPLAERLAAVRLCRERSVHAGSALVQPILPPYLTEEGLEVFLVALRDAGIVNFKPELLTVDPECLAIIGQIVGHHDREKERQLYEAYLAPQNRDHRKQRDRTAPDRGWSRRAIELMLRAGQRLGLTVSICYWVRRELGIGEELIPVINRNGFQCLGYQTRLFESAPEDRP